MRLIQYIAFVFIYITLNSFFYPAQPLGFVVMSSLFIIVEL